MSGTRAASQRSNPRLASRMSTAADISGGRARLPPPAARWRISATAPNWPALELLRELQRDGAWLCRRGVVAHDAARAALVEAEQLTALVKRVGEKQVERVARPRQAERQVERAERRLLPDLPALHDAQVVPLRALVDERRLA